MPGVTTELLRMEKSVDAMGSTFSIVLYGREWLPMESAVDAAFDEVCRLEMMLSVHRPESECSEVNRHAALRAIRLSQELFQLLSRCLEYSRQSEGTFDISVGPLIKAWGFHQGTGGRPDEAEVKAALAIVGYRHIHLDPAARTVRLDRMGMEINLGGIGKGYAVDRMAHILKQRGFDAALIVGSGSSIYGLGSPPGEASGWPVDIRDPRNPRKVAASAFLKNMSISTSGSYEKSFWADGRTYCHILDPRTGYPVQGVLSVSVITPHALDSEAWTKPCFVLGRHWAAGHGPERARIFYCEERPGAACDWLR
jgi:thiamine biosynthesis lipoprotein